MPNTANYSFPTPADTDLVKNGADAIRDLGDAVDTAMNTALGTKKAGMVLLNTTSFSAVIGQNINDVFSSTYDNYRILLDVTGSTSITLSMRFRVAGADNTTSNYYYQYIQGSSTTVAGARAAASTSWVLDGGLGTERFNYVLDLANPNLATTKSMIELGSQLYSSAAGIKTFFASYGFGAATSFTGFTILASTGNITGTVSVYGYNK
jgi:hypothetical protein